MSKLDTNHVVNLDLVKDRVNSVIKFGLADVETSDFFVGLYNNGSRVFDKDYIVTLYIVKPNGTFRNIKLEPKEGLKKYYCNLPDTLKNIPGEYVCQVMVFDNLTNEKKISKSKFKYSVSVDLASEMAGIIDEEEQESVLTNILNRLLTLENPVEPYATQKHVDECVSTLTEEIDTIKVKDTEQDGKLVDIESKNTEQDERLNAIESKNTEQDNRLNSLESKDLIHESRMTNIESKNTEQDEKLNNIETKNTEQDNRLDIAENRLANIGNDITNTMQPIIDEHTARLDAIEAIDVSQNNRLDAIEAKNTEQDNRLLDVEKVNKRQDIDIKCLYGASQTIDVTEEGNSIYLQNSNNGFVAIDEIKGNTIVNCNKEPDKELILNGNINTSGDNTVTLTEGVDGGLVDVCLEGNTLVNLMTDYKTESLIEYFYPIQNNDVANVSMLKPNTVYTLIYTAKYQKTGDGGSLVIEMTNNRNEAIFTNQELTESYSKYSYKFTTPSSADYFVLRSNSSYFYIKECMLLEGDWTDKEIPQYFEGMKSVGECEVLEITSANSDNSLLNTQRLTHEPLRAVGDAKDRYVLIDGKWYIERKCGVRAYQEGDKDNYKTDLVNTVYPLEMPTYEEIDYNPLEVYSGTTHITTNSTIPANIVVKNHGFNCLLKPNTTYTVSSNLGINTVTTPSTLTEDCLRFMDADTSDVTTMKNVLVLEGDWTSKSNLIPANFSGMESAFEQEYDAEKGKYKVNVKVANEDKSNENNITFYINEPLRGVEGVKDRIFIQGDKVIVERNCGGAILDGIRNWSINSSFTNNNFLCISMANTSINRLNKSNVYCATLPCLSHSQATSNWVVVKECVRTDSSSALYLYLSKIKCNENTFVSYLQQNPVTVVYQLAEPVYEEVEYNDVKLFIESFKNSTLFYNSNVPVTSTLHYSYSVPIVDTVAQTANVTDQQDSMIIDLAAQCAIMEMYLM